jgi:uncharacterized membrane protein YidH (DUF202 family)
MSGIGSIVFGGLIIIFVALGVITFFYIQQNLGTSDNRAEVSTTIGKIAIANSVLVFILAIISYMFTNNNPLVRPTYTLVMMHITLLFSITAVSIAMIEKLS